MYKVERKDGRVIVVDWNDKPVYSASDESYIIYKPGVTANPTAVRLKALTDDQVLTALATAITLSL